MGDMFLRVAGIVEDSIVDGPGVRMSIFMQGCERGCPGCHNPQTHALDGGESRSIEELAAMYADNPLLDGVTFSGGEPFLQALPLAMLARKIHALGGNVVTYSGFTLEELLSSPMSGKEGVQELVAASDWLIDGPYIESRRSLELLFRGSSNQRFLRRICSRFRKI